MILFSIFSGIGLVGILAYVSFHGVRRENVSRVILGLIFLLLVFSLSTVAEVYAPNYMKVNERVVTTDYLDIEYNKTLVFEEPVEVRIVEYDYPGYSLIHSDRFEYEISW